MAPSYKLFLRFAKQILPWLKHHTKMLNLLQSLTKVYTVTMIMTTCKSTCSSWTQSKFFPLTTRNSHQVYISSCWSNAACTLKTGNPRRTHSNSRYNMVVLSRCCSWSTWLFRYIEIPIYFMLHCGFIAMLLTFSLLLLCRLE